MGDKLAVVLTLNEWNIILGILAKQPYEMSASLIQQIQTQAQQQAQAQQVQAPTSGFLSNGADQLAPIGPAAGFSPRGGE